MSTNTKTVAKAANANQVEVVDQKVTPEIELSNDVKTEKKVDFDRLSKSGGDFWLVMLKGAVAGIPYLFTFSKIISFTSQLTKGTLKAISDGKITMEDEDLLKYFSYVSVMMTDGTVLKLPLNEGLYDTYYSRFCDDEGNILDDHRADEIQVAFTVTTYVDKHGQELLEKGTKYPKKDVSPIEYIELVADVA